MITYMNTGDDIFISPAQAIVIPVNCKGRMGAGLALLFAAKEPEAAKSYMTYCQKNDMQPGSVLYLGMGGEGPDYILAATKDKWQYPSTKIWVNNCLAHIRQIIVERSLASVALPALGCGKGKLAWDSVRPLVEQFLADSIAEVFVYPPHEKAAPTG